VSNGARAPRVWVLAGAKAGDRAQMTALAAALDWPFEIRRLVFRSWELALHVAPRPTVLALDPVASDRLVPPWPDLVISAGRRNELPALWIREQSGSRAKVVHVGRPWSHPRRFDLVVSSRQYELASGPNVLVNDLPLHALDVTALEAAREAWSSRLESRPAPRVAVLIGGSSGPLVLTVARARRLGELVDHFVRRHSGSVLVSNSPRTPPGVLDAVLGALTEPAFVHRFAHGGENPYLALLACADAFVVTADSVSMVAEATATGRPVFVYDFMPEIPWWLDPTAWRWRPWVHRLSLAVGPRRMRRNVHRLHSALVDAGRVRWFDEHSAPFAPAGVDGEELVRTVARVRALFE
jgi:mitochondrial fission protein ELM1